MKTYLVTGGAGFIGSHLAENLLHKGHFVRVVDNLSSGKKKNIEFLQSLKGHFEFIEGDLTKPPVAQEAIKGIEVVFHEAAVGSVPKSVKDPITSHHANVTATVELLWAAKEAGVSSFVCAASSSAYGETPELPKRETMLPNCLSPYAVTKLAQEQYCKAFAHSYGLNTISLRYFNVYGPRQDPNSHYAAVIPAFAKACLENKRPVIYGDGAQTRDFTFVQDVVNANLLASEIKGAKGEVYNIAGGKKITIQDLAKQIASVLGKKIEPENVAPRKGDILHSLADISAAKKAFGYHPQTPFEKGLELTVRWYAENYVPAE